MQRKGYTPGSQSDPDTKEGEGLLSEKERGDDGGGGGGGGRGDLDGESLTKKNKIEIRKSDKVELKRNVGLLNGVTIIVGSIIGSGIFLTPTDVYKYAQNSYGAIAIWGSCGLFSLVGALCFAELGTSITKNGGDFAYIHEAYGPLPGFLCLWVTIMAIRPATAAIIAITFANYIIRPFYPNCDGPAFAATFLAACLILLLTAVNCMSVKVTLILQDFFTYAKLIGLALIIGFGVLYFARGLIDPPGPYGQMLRNNTFANEFPYEGKDFNFALISLSFYQGLFAYAGWNYLNFVTQEMKDPYKNLPRAIWIGLPLVTVVYVLANCAYFIVLPPNDLIKSNEVAVSFGELTFQSWNWIVPIFVVLSTAGGVNGTLFTASRLFFAGAEEKQLPQILSCVHVSKFTPVPALILQGLISVAIIFTGSTGFLITYVSFVLWVSTGVSVAALLTLRRKKPDLPRPIRVNSILPYTYIIFTTFLVGCSIYADPFSTGVGTILTLSGIPVYFFFVVWRERIWKSSNKWIDKFSQELQKMFNVIPQEKNETML